MPPPGADRCIPNYWAEPGDEDPVAFCAQGNRIYVVTSGTVCGVFSSEARARKQITGVSNAHWRAVKSWAKAIQVWNESCDMYHETRCPHQSRMPAPPLRQRAQFPANGFVTSAPSRSPPARPACMHAVATAMPARSTPHSPVSSIGLQSPSTPKSLPRAQVPQVPVSSIRIEGPSTPAPHTRTCVPRVPVSPLAMMDVVDAFSGMGVADPSAQTRPPKQWVIGGIDHGVPRNIHKLRVFTKGVEYVWKPGHAWDSDEE
ncbi:hypothetical protein DFH08DRAFT_820539 [Mycena albidolilacea]|uniref:Uncharacterized protein n=1 Tax=Mycena albidolilacea TaxID=1033008 RepID=A0AAD7EEN2_9AGAR|nr:hypothetical protein DFH08DRAFT_820539 [Mycena albidolilacea]